MISLRRGAGEPDLHHESNAVAVHDHVGLGARVALGSRVFVAPEFRQGWEPETRIDEVWDYFTTIGGGARWFVGPDWRSAPKSQLPFVGKPGSKPLTIRLMLPSKSWSTCSQPETLREKSAESAG
jgi:hypothetical protein